MMRAVVEPMEPIVRFPFHTRAYTRAHVWGPNRTIGSISSIGSK